MTGRRERNTLFVVQFSETFTCVGVQTRVQRFQLLVQSFHLSGEVFGLVPTPPAGPFVGVSVQTSGLVQYRHVFGELRFHLLARGVSPRVESPGKLVVVTFGGHEVSHAGVHVEAFLVLVADLGDAVQLLQLGG